MGLASKANVGVKAQLQARFPAAFKRFDSLVDARDASLAERAHTVITLDGNVMLMAVPAAITTLSAYVAYTTKIVLAAVATADVTVVVFDEPDAITVAKQQEQARRDQRRAARTVPCSGDLLAAPQSDDYVLDDIAALADVRELMAARATRMRFVDEVCRQIVAGIARQIAAWTSSGHPGGHLVVDGVDPRGAARPVGAGREAQVVGTSPEVAQLFERSFRIGEGDLKLAHVGRVARRGTPVFASTKLVMVSTIDTDSYAIELVEQAKRAADPEDGVHTLLCMRERAVKRGRDDDRDAHFLCADVTLLAKLVQKHLWGVGRSVSPSEERASMTWLVAGFVLCGCDFVEAVKGLCSDTVLDVMPRLLSKRPELLAAMEAAWLGDRGRLVELHDPLKTLLQECSAKLVDKPRMKWDTISSMRNTDEVVLRRASWVSAYWNSVEFRGNLDDFGFVRPHA